VISWKTIRRTGTLGLSVSRRCQAMASPSRSGSVARYSSSASLRRLLSSVTFDFFSGLTTRLEVVLDVHTETGPRLALVLRGHVRRASRQVTDVADRSLHDIVLAEVRRDLLGLRR